MLLTLGDLVVLCGAASACWLRPTRSAAWLLVACSALWLPLNNGHMEGAVLVSVDPRHGLTTADLIGYGGWIIAAWALYRIRHPRTAGPRWLPLAAAVLVLAGGMTVSYFVQPAQHDGAVSTRVR